jgi:hypothetical protein
LSWAPPTSTLDESSPSWYYSIEICELVSVPGGPAECNLLSTGSTFSFITDSSFTVPTGLLQAGQSYIFMIAADSYQGWKSEEPERCNYPSFATPLVVSNVITVNSGTNNGGTSSSASVFAKAKSDKAAKVSSQSRSTQLPSLMAAGPITTGLRSSQQARSIKMLEQQGVYVPRIIRERWLHHSLVPYAMP